jgi:hypothetical protein
MSIVDHLVKNFGEDNPIAQRILNKDVSIIKDFEAMIFPEPIKRPIIDSLMKEWQLSVETDEEALSVLDHLLSLSLFNKEERETLLQLKDIANVDLDEETDVSILLDLIKIDNVGQRLSGMISEQIRYRNVIIHLMLTLN